MKNRNTKRRLLLMLYIAAFNFTATAQNGTTISEMLRAQNYWMPHFPAYGHHNGQVDLYWQQIKASGVKYMRIGGKSYDQDNMFSADDLAGIINNMRSHGIEPIVQVPIDPEESISQNAVITASYVTAMNTTTRLAYPVEYWEIGNEPNTYTATPTFTAANGDYTTDAVIAAYTRSCSVAMKAVTGQEHIKIIGPSLNAYHPSSFQAFLTPTNTAFIGGLSSAGYPYIDFIAFN